MIFIGVVSDNKKYNILIKLLSENINKKEYTLVNINKNSIDNLKNVKFDIIIFLEVIEKIEANEEYLNSNCFNLKYFIVNSDIDYNGNYFNNIKTNIITFGLNHLSTVTFSSVKDESVLISVQRKFLNLNREVIDVGEYGVEIQKSERSFLYEILVAFIINNIINIKNN